MMKSDLMIDGQEVMRSDMVCLKGDGSGCNGSDVTIGLGGRRKEGEK
jgi:hypothetical protein